MQKYLIYYCEIKKLIPPKDGVRLDGFEYCDGWTDYQKMGVSAVGIYRSWIELPYVWADGYDFSLPEVFSEEPDCVIVGFNTKKFDDLLMEANGVSIKTDYDLLEEVLIAAGQNGKPCWNKGSYSLGRIGEANGFPKTGTGKRAPKLWQEGRHQEVIDYCANDVAITRSLLCKGLAGELVDPNTGEKLKLRTFEEVLANVR